MPYVGVDQAAAMGKVIGHLREQGCQRFAYITPHPAISTASERLDAFLRRTARVDPTASQRVYRGDFSLEWGHEAARRIIAERPRPDAIVCANDLNAIGALQALREEGLAVPGEVAVSGFDDTILAVACHPQLTTVRQPLEDIGRQAVTVLRAAMADPSLPPTLAVLKADLVVRDSTLRAGGAGGRRPSGREAGRKLRPSREPAR
jgi:LacI family transcriptional regulator